MYSKISSRSASARAHIGASCAPIASEHLFDIFITRQITPPRARFDSFPFFIGNPIVCMALFPTQWALSPPAHPGLAAARPMIASPDDLMPICFRLSLRVVTASLRRRSEVRFVRFRNRRFGSWEPLGVFGANKFVPFDERAAIRYGRGPGRSEDAFILDRELKLQVLALIVRAPGSQDLNFSFASRSRASFAASKSTSRYRSTTCRPSVCGVQTCRPWKPVRP